MLFDPYKSQSGSRHGSFPSGHVRTNKYLILKSRTIPFKNFSVGIDSHIDLKHSGEASVLEYLTFSVRYQFSFLIINI